MNEIAEFANIANLPTLHFTDLLDILHTPISKINSDLEPYKHSLKIAHLNAVSIPKHRDEIYRVLREANFDILAISETNIKPGTPTALFKMPGYKFIRVDRTHTTKGGIGLYFKDVFNPKIIPINYNNLQPELLFTEVEINRNKIAVGVIYKSPSASYGIYAEIQEILAFITTKYNHVILLGDFNIDLLKNNRQSEFFRNVILMPFALHQVITVPTRITQNTATSIDHIFVNSSENVQFAGVADFPGISDHCLIYMAYNLKRPKFVPITVTRRDFRNLDKQAFIHDMDFAPWGNIFAMDENDQELDLDDKVTVVENIFRENINKHAPFREIKITKPIKAAWMLPEIVCLMDKRDLYKNMFNRYKDDFFFDRYKELRNEVNHKIRRAKIDDFNSTINNKIRESRDFHSALKQHNVVSSKKMEQVPCVYTPDQLNNTFITNNNAPVDLDKIAQTISKINRQEKKGGRFHFREVTELDIINVVKTLKSNSCGLDEISAFFVKLSIQQSAAAIAEIVNVSFRYNKFPERWKKAIVIGIPKIPNPLTPSDYRPISLLSVFSKIIEKIAAKQMTQYLILHELLDKNQSAYKPEHSTGTALLDITDFIFQALDQSYIVIKVLLDYSKAFDCANHNIILAKLKSIGFTNSALNWINSYLSGRSQSVKTEAGRSEWKNLSNGVPQGSILGPLLFTILLLDLKDSIKHCNVHLYADDTQIYISGKIEDILTLFDKINIDLKGILEFSVANNLTLNVKNVNILFLGPPLN